MKKFILGLLVVLTVIPSYAATSVQVATLTAMVRKGTCSLKDKDWCPTYAIDANGGFLMNATAVSVRSMNLNYDNLTAMCFIWKTAGGKADASASLLVTDQTGHVLLLSRNCE